MMIGRHRERRFPELSYHGCRLGAHMHEPEGPYASGADEVTL
jgi:hypothetical protein